MARRDAADTTTSDVAGIAPDVPEDPDAVADGEGHTYPMAGYPDGPVTFSRPGVEELTFQVKGEQISTTQERHRWLLAHVAGTVPAAE